MAAAPGRRARSAAAWAAMSSRRRRRIHRALPVRQMTAQFRDPDDHHRGSPDLALRGTSGSSPADGPGRGRPDRQGAAGPARRHGRGEILAVVQWDEASASPGHTATGPTWRRSAQRFDPPGGNADTCIGDAVDLGWKLAASSRLGRRRCCPVTSANATVCAVTGGLAGEGDPAPVRPLPRPAPPGSSWPSPEQSRPGGHHRSPYLGSGPQRYARGGGLLVTDGSTVHHGESRRPIREAMPPRPGPRHPINNLPIGGAERGRWHSRMALVRPVRNACAATSAPDGPGSAICHRASERDHVTVAAGPAPGKIYSHKNPERDRADVIDDH